MIRNAEEDWADRKRFFRMDRRFCILDPISGDESAVQGI